MKKDGDSIMFRVYRTGRDHLQIGEDHTSQYVPIKIVKSFSYNNDDDCIEVRDWSDKIVKTENILEVSASWPVKILYRNLEINKCEWIEVAMSYNQMYNLLHRDCSNYPYSPYGNVIKKEKKKEDELPIEEELL